jgi:RHS repeat-associated protein
MPVASRSTHDQYPVVVPSAAGLGTGERYEKTVNATHLFYQHDKLVNVSQGGQKRALFRNAEVPLAELLNDLTASAALVSTDDNGSVLNVRSESEAPGLVYSPYGHDDAKARMLSLLRFNGQYRTDQGYYLLGNGFRAYSPGMMRFCSSDNLSPFGKGGLNSYCYCLGDPVNRTDPTGHNSSSKTSRKSPSVSFTRVQLGMIDLVAQLRSEREIMQLSLLRDEQWMEWNRGEHVNQEWEIVQLTSEIDQAADFLRRQGITVQMPDGQKNTQSRFARHQNPPILERMLESARKQMGLKWTSNTNSNTNSNTTSNLTRSNSTRSNSTRSKRINPKLWLFLR